MRPKIICVDIDETLTVECCFTVHDCMTATPREAVIHKINELHETHFIVLYTGRRIQLAEATLKWLTKHHVRYHAIKFEKLPYDIIIDSSAVNIEFMVHGGKIDTG